MYFAVPADHRIKLKEGKKKDKYLDFAGELKILRNMKVTILPIVIGALRFKKGMEDLEIRGRVETTQTIALLRSEYWEESWRLEKTCCHSNSSERPSVSADV